MNQLKKFFINHVISFFVFSILLICSTDLFAVSPGFYMGLKLGPATNSGNTEMLQTQPDLGLPQLTPGTPRSQQFGTRFFLGYKMNQYADFESGFDYFTGIKYDTKDVPTCSGAQARIRSFDILGKGTYPFTEWLNVFGKIGPALVYQTLSGDINTDLTQPCGKTTYTTKVRTEIGIGVNYNLSQSWVTELSWDRLLVSGPIGSVDFFGISLSYHFVDVYCGQFLCDD